MCCYPVKTHYLCKTLLLLCLIAIPTFINGCDNEQPKPKTEEKSEKSGKPVMRILFVGNQLSSINGMPDFVAAFAQNDPSAHFDVEVGQFVARNASLAQLWKHQKRQEILTQKKWDYVILQPHPLWATDESSVYFTHKALTLWKKSIEGVGAFPVLIMNWPLEVTDPLYGHPNYFALKNPKNMHRLLRGYSKAMAKKNDMLLLPVGDYWMYCMSKNTNISLYGKNTENVDDSSDEEESIENTITKLLPKLTDGSYPSLEESFAKTIAANEVSFGKVSAKTIETSMPFASNESMPSREGAFLNALIVYKTLVDKSLNDVDYLPKGMSETTKDTLIAIASAKSGE